MKGNGMTILDEIVEYKRRVLEEAKEKLPINEIYQRIETLIPTVDFIGNLKKHEGISIIAEVKKASPSKGLIRRDFDYRAIVEEYENCKVEAVSILTEDRYFLGDLRYLEEIRQKTCLPLLRKDFIFDEYQVYESRAFGADAILLIAGILSSKRIAELMKTAESVDLQCIVEVHNRQELAIVLNTPARIIGINNRDLETFITDIRTTEKLMPYIPKDKIVESESGIHSFEDMEYLKELGVNSVLVGERLMRAAAIGEAIDELRYGGVRDGAGKNMRAQA